MDRREMKGDCRLHVSPGRIRTAIACACVATLLVCHHTVADAPRSDAAQVPPLIVFAQSEAPASEPPLSADAAATLEAVRSDPAASEVRIGYSDPAPVLSARAMSLALPSASGASAPSVDTDIVFTDIEVRYNEEGLTSLYAIDDATDTEVALVIQGSDVVGSIRRGGEVFNIRPLGDGMTAVYRFDASKLRRHPEGWEDLIENGGNESFHDEDRDVHGPEDPDARSRGDPATPNTAADAGDEIDILVAHTARAEAEQGNIDAFIQFAIDNTHRTYGNSGIELRLRLVHKHEVSYTQTSSMRTDIRRLTFTAGDSGGGDPLGYMDEVHGLRDRYGADLVVLIVGQNTAAACGIAWRPRYQEYPTRDYSHLGFSVVAQNCESLTHHTFAHELGHNQGAAHDPFNVVNGYSFPWGHGFCNNADDWNTVMAYASNEAGACRREIPYFSSPMFRFQGTPTGDAATRDNRRVLLTTAGRVANFRKSKAPQTRTHSLPLVPLASTVARQGFVRVINNSDRDGEVTIRAIDDTGRRSDPVALSLEAKEAIHFNSHDLENGNSEKGLIGGVGKGSGAWRLVLTTKLEIEPLAYIRTPDGFVTSMHEVAAETQEGTNRYHVPFFNPGKNTNQVSALRLINPGNGTASIMIAAVDDGGRDTSPDAVQLELGAGMARTLTASQLETCGSGLDGCLGPSDGKWRLSVSADRPIQVMSLLGLPTGHLTNLSRGYDGSSFGMPPPPPLSDPSDLVIQSASVSDSNPKEGQSFTLRATVRNQGTGRSAATRLRYHRSTDSMIAGTDAQVGVATVEALPAAGISNQSVSVTAPSTPGTYYFGACIDPVPGETDSENNCSSAVQVAVQSAGPKFSMWEITDGCIDGKRIKYRLFGLDEANAHRETWPNPDDLFFTPADGPGATHTLECAIGTTKVCYGARVEGDDSVGYWGVDIDGRKGCSVCCSSCRLNSTTRRVRFTCS